MESGEGVPKEEMEEDNSLQEDDFFETDQKYLDFLERFNKYKINEYKKEEYPDLNLPTLDPIRKNTIQELKSMPKDIFNNLYEKYFDNETERKKILANKDSFKPFETKNENIQDFIELSKNISQLEKEIYSETGKELMFLLGEKESTPIKNT